MAHVVVPSTQSNNDEKKGIKESRKENVIESQERRKEDARERVELERKRFREGEIAKKRLRVLATQKCKTDQETVEALEQINQMSPEDALRNLDLHLAKAEAGFADKMAISIRDGIGGILDRLLRANGCISARFQSDHALQSALTNELGYIATFVSNKAVIALSAASDVVGGYQDSLLNKVIVQVEAKNEVINEIKDLNNPFSIVQQKEEGGEKPKKEKKKQCQKIKVSKPSPTKGLMSPLPQAKMIPSSPLEVIS